MAAHGTFRYGAPALTADGVLTCTYELGGRTFEEVVALGRPVDVEDPAIQAAARLVFLLAGISYYKTAAPPVLDLGEHALTTAERALLQAFYVDGLGEYAHENGLDLTGLRVEAPERAPSTQAHRSPTGRPLVPFGGGIDSIVTVEGTKRRADDVALFVAGRAGARFEAIEAPAALTGLPVRRAERTIDPQVLRSAELGFLNGHVPITGVLSAVAVLAALADGRDAVIMSNEWSASKGNLQVEGRWVNHQWSKSAEFEGLLSAVLAETFGEGLVCFSYLRPFSELWVARRFAQLGEYHPVFRSCNKAFFQDPVLRLDHWCGTCDKCCFIDLILSPYLPAAELDVIFDGHEPLRDPALIDRFRSLIGTSADPKPFECVGDVDECRVAVQLAVVRPDRASTPLLTQLADEARAAGGPGVEQADALLGPLSPHGIPTRYAPDDLLV